MLLSRTMNTTLPNFLSQPRPCRSHYTAANCLSACSVRKFRNQYRKHSSVFSRANAIDSHAPELDGDYGDSEYGEDLQPLQAYDPDLDGMESGVLSEKSELSVEDAYRISQVAVIESYGLSLGTLVKKEPMEPTPVLTEWEDVFEEEFLAEGGEEEEEEELTAEEQYEREQVDFHFEARRRHEMACVQDMAFDLHHSQMARSVNQFATTNAYGDMLQWLSKIDELSVDNADAIPIWMRANFVFEEDFDDRNEDLKQTILETDARQAQLEKQALENMDFEMLDESDFMEEMELVSTAMKRASDPAAMEDSAEQPTPGMGDDLDSLLNVLPGAGRDSNVDTEGFVSEMLSTSADAPDEDEDFDSETNDLEWVEQLENE